MKSREYREGYGQAVADALRLLKEHVAMCEHARTEATHIDALAGTGSIFPLPADGEEKAKEIRLHLSGLKASVAIVKSLKAKHK